MQYLELNERMRECKGAKVDSDLQSLLKVTVSESGMKHINQEVHDWEVIVKSEKRVSDQRLVYIWLRLLEYKDTKKGKELIKRGKNLYESEQSQRIKRDMKEVVQELKQEIKVGDRTVEIDNDKLKEIAKKADAINTDYENL